MMRYGGRPRREVGSRGRGPIGRSIAEAVVRDGRDEAYRAGCHRSSIASDRMVEDLAASTQREAHMTMPLDEYLSTIDWDS